MATRYVSLFLTTAVMLLAAACGGDDPSPTPSPAIHGGTTLPQSRVSPVPITTLPTAAAPSRDPTPTSDPGTTVPFKATGDPNPPRGISLLQTVRIATQDGWDRIVFEFKDTRPAVEIAYVDREQTCGKGDNVSLPGAAMLSVKFRQTQAHTDAGVPSLPSREMPGPGSTILRASVICDFEGETGVAIGVKTKTPYKVTMLQNPTRVVIDVKQ